MLPLHQANMGEGFLEAKHRANNTYLPSSSPFVFEVSICTILKNTYILIQQQFTPT